MGFVMTTELEGAMRLKTLAAFLLTVPEEKFDLSVWVKLTRDTPSPECGFAGCAVGWAAQIPEFKALGFGLGGILESCPEFEGRHSWQAVEDFFGLRFNDCANLFTSVAYNEYHATPKEVSERITQYLKTTAIFAV